MDSPPMNHRFLVLSPTIHAETNLEDLTSNNPDLLPSSAEKDQSLSESCVENFKSSSPVVFPNMFLRLGPNTSPQPASK